MRKRLRLGGVTHFGNYPVKRASVDRQVDRFIREGSCRHRHCLESPCESFDAASEGKCKRDGRICDLLTEKGERYRLGYE